MISLAMWLFSGGGSHLQANDKYFKENKNNFTTIARKLTSIMFMAERRARGTRRTILDSTMVEV